MVKVAVAGGSGELAREVIDALIATKRHEITVLTRRSLVDQGSSHFSTRVVDYNDEDELVGTLKGIHTVLSFINQPSTEHLKSSQKLLIDACVLAGVKRFAPSEYGSHDKVDLPFWLAKVEIEDYLKKLNGKEDILEYTLFQPGLFLDYLASPYQTARYITPLDTFIDFQKRRAIIVDGYEDAVITLTTVRDIAEVVVRAVDFAGKWPKVGGIRGNRVPISKILEIGEKIRGCPFTVDKVRLEDLEAGNLLTSWQLGNKHPSFTENQTGELAAMFKTVLIGMLVSSAKGAWDVSDAFNQLLPEYTFTEVEAFLSSVWDGKP